MNIRLYNSSGWLVINGNFYKSLYLLGLCTPDDFLNVGGIIINGNADRHVRQIYLPGIGIAYLKREHRIRYSNKSKNYIYNGLFISRCCYEGKILHFLSTKTNLIPQWIAYGENDRKQAFLLLMSLYSIENIINYLKINAVNIKCIARSLGAELARLNNIGISTSHITLNHTFINTVTKQLYFLDWESYRKSTTKFLNGILHTIKNIYTGLCNYKYDINIQSFMRYFIESYLSLIKRTYIESTIITKYADSLAKLNNIYELRKSHITPSKKTIKLVWLYDENVCITPDGSEW
jgi:hypothetical protein